MQKQKQRKANEDEGIKTPLVLLKIVKCTAKCFNLYTISTVFISAVLVYIQRNFRVVAIAFVCFVVVAAAAYHIQNVERN